MMDERERRDIMLRAIHRYGEAAQIDMAVKEMAELTIQGAVAVAVELLRQG